MKDNRSRRGIQGFTLVETVLAISILSFAAVMGSRTLLDSTRTIHRLRYQKKASALVEMVFQQYTAYSVQNYQLLSIYNATNQQPMVFFNRPDNFGYDGILITTLATYSSNRSSCTVNVSLSWNDGGTPKTSSYVKTFVETSQLGTGAALQVWLKAPCAQGTTNDSIIANCPGLPGFTLSALSSSGGSTIYGITDANGQALLKQVMLGDNVQIQVMAPTVADYGDSTAAPSYYGMDSNGNYFISTTKVVVLNPANLNTLVVTDFQPLGQVKGQFINDDIQNSNPPVSGLTARANYGAIMYSTTTGSFVNCLSQALCRVVSDVNGRFMFNNVVPSPTLSNAFQISPEGTYGSSPYIQQTDPNFSQGYTNAHDVVIPQSVWSPPASVNPANQGPIVQTTLHVQKMGWVSLHVVNLVTSQPLPNLVVSVNAMQENYTLPPTDSNGNIQINNVYSGIGNQTIEAIASHAPQGGLNHGYNGDYTWSCPSGCTAQNNPVTFQVMPGYLLQGQFVDDNPSPHLNGMYVSTFWNPSMASNDTPLSSNGSFSMDGYFPNTNWGGTVTNDPSVPSQQILFLENDDDSFSATLTGNTVDDVTGGVARHAMFAIENGQGGYTEGTSDGNGFFSFTSTFAYTTTQTVTMVCNNTTMVCSICPGNSSCAPGGSPIHIDTRNNTIGTTATQDQNLHGYVNDNWQTIPVSRGGSSDPQTLPCVLKQYMVSGTVTDSANHPLGGANVDDGNGQLVGTSSSQTSTLGTYSGWATVDQHTSSNPGFISLYAGGVTINGTTYQGTSLGPISFPSYIDPTAPISQNITLTPAVSGGGSGGGGI